MDSEIDHYIVLGLPSGEEGAKLTDKDITKGYRQKALELHPDKRRDDPNAHENFQKLKTSYEVLKDEKARKLFDDLLKIKREKVLRQSQQDSKRRKKMSDLEERERSAFSPDFSGRHQNEEEIIARKLKEEIARIRAMHANKGTSPVSSMGKDTMQGRKESTTGRQSGLDKEKMLKVTWEKIGEGYKAQQIKDLFEKFGVVEDVLIQSSKKKKGSALVVMASKEAVVAVTGEVLGDLSNPLFIMPLQSAQPSASPPVSNAQKVAETDGPKLSNLVGSGYQAFEESVLEKLKKVLLLQDRS
ncbi:chaperone [Lithospermum erythrorhizon]|uniref:Chaperone n=1 Tax=Lithospermum erythrorhizon TaxID=34254 RepID=A0AAV3PN02_LITER